MSSRIALLAGATGLVGRALVREILKQERYRKLEVLLRRAAPDFPVNPKLELHVVEFSALPEKLPTAEDVYIALGTTLKAAGSRAAFRLVDFEYVVGLARAARQTSATRLAIVSAAGADVGSRVFYNRVKGEMQVAVSELGYESVVFAQPSLLLGDRTDLAQPARTAEVWAQRLLGPLSGLLPAGIRPIRAETVASSLVASMSQPRPGVTMLSSREMQAES